MMEEKCFYCANTLEDKYHHGIFIIDNEHVDKPLCSDCYQDWLDGMKD